MTNGHAIEPRTRPLARTKAAHMGSGNHFGEIDIATVETFTAELHAIVDVADTRRVVIDCSSITFMDSSGYHAFLSAARYAQRRGHALVIANLPEPYARVLHLCDPDQHLKTEPSPLSVF